MDSSSDLRSYNALFMAAFVASILMLVIIPSQIAAFVIVPMPDSVEAWFSLFAEKPLAALFHADLFILVDNILIAVIYLAFYRLLKERNRGLAQIAVVLGLVGIAAYISSNKTFELLSLSRLYLRATAASDRAMYAAAGQAMLSSWQGTAFDAYYVLNGITLLIVALLMLKSEHFSKATALVGLAAAFFMIVPSTAGTVGLVFSLLSLIPWYAFTIMYSRVFLRVYRASCAP